MTRGKRGREERGDETVDKPDGEMMRRDSRKQRREIRREVGEREEIDRIYSRE